MSGTGAIALVARSAVRGRALSIIIVVAVAAMVSLASLTATAGARRTATVIDRMVAAQPRPDHEVGIYQTTNVNDAERLRATEVALEALPDVDRAIAVADIYAAVGPVDESWYLQVSTGLDARFVESGWFGTPSEGRIPTADGVREVALGRSTAERLGLELGDEFVIPTISAATIGELLRGAEPDNAVDGAELRLDVVGILGEDITADSAAGVAVASPDTAAYLGSAGASSGYFVMQGDDEVDPAELAQVVADAMEVPPSSVYYVDVDLALDPVRDAVRITAAGLAVFAALSAAAGMIALGLTVGRQVADTGRLTAATSALGMRDRQNALAIALPSSCAAGVGILAGAIGAAALSPIFPTGQGRLAEPEPGVRLDWPVLVVGAVVLLIVVSAWSYVAAWQSHGRNGRQRSVVERRRRPGLQRGVPVTVALGSGLVLAPGRGRAGVRPGSALVGMVLAVTGVLAISVFVVSRDTTANDPVRFGAVYDAEGDLSHDDPDELLRALAEEPALDGVALIECGSASVGGLGIELCGAEVLSGSSPWVFLSGTGPQAPGEVAVGKGTAHELDIEIGDRIDVKGLTGEVRDLEVVGVVVLPNWDDAGSGLISTAETTRAITGEDSLPTLLMSFAPDLPPGDVEELLAVEYDLTRGELSGPQPPLLVDRLDLVRPTLVALAVLLSLLGAIGLVHYLLLSTARRAGESAVLRALGFLRGQALAVVMWQAITIALIGVVLGVPLGVMVGRSAWIESIDQLGIIDDPTVPWGIVVLVVAAVLSGAAVAGVVTGIRSVRARAVAIVPE